MLTRSDQPTHIEYSPVAFARGDHDGTGATPAGIGVAAPVGVREYADPFAPKPVRRRRFTHASWTSPEVESGFVFGELVPTWHADTPGDSWLEVMARARSAASRRWSRWLVLARWADHDATVRPASVPDERAMADDVASVDTDTLRAPEGADAWQLRVTLLQAEDAALAGPTLTYLGAMASSFTPAALRRSACTVPPSAVGCAAGRILDVPAYSQRIHAGRHPEWGGGDVWCSPTSLAMILAFWGTGPDSDALSWVHPDYPDRSVYHAVRHCWDHAYDGAGNWSFNTAYAARFGLSSFVTRLRDLTEAEAFIAVGIPLVASLYIDPSKLSGADYSSAGHLVVVSGFTPAGDVVVNDPAARDRATVRRVYRRGEFEHAWRCGSGGIVYVIHPPTIGLPRRPPEPNW
jgi:hypothetical protein